MSKISRNDVFVRSERGPDWLDDFLHIYSQSSKSPSSIDEILSAINNKKAETVESVVENYRKQVGLDALADDENNESHVKQASRTPLSIRHAQLNNEDSIVLVIKQDPSMIKAIDSFCEHSGGTKNTHSIINFLRSKLGKEKVSYTDQDLIDYIEERKSSFRKDDVEADENKDVGEAGLSNVEDDYGDRMADYVQHGQPGEK